MTTDEYTLSQAKRAFVVAPAGFGKTELIAKSIALTPGRSLILTHTHAGVNAMRSRLRRLGVDRRKYEVATIAGWCLKHCAAYPRLSHLITTMPTGNEWPSIYDSMLTLLESKAVRTMLLNSYSALYVDEYQDCNARHHAIVLNLAELMPCRILGDPLQGIFDFKNDPTIIWTDDVEPNFERLQNLEIPHRWTTSNPQLGEWLVETRTALLRGSEISMTDSPITWMASGFQNQQRASYSATRNKDETCVIIANVANSSHSFARGMGGFVGSMEEMDCTDLMEFTRNLDASRDGHDHAVLLIDFASRCFTAVKSELGKARTQYLDGKLVVSRLIGDSRDSIEALNRLAAEPDRETLGKAIQAIEKHPKAKLFRPELWSELRRAVRDAQSTQKFEERAWLTRERTRRYGRRPEQRVVSRTLLIKGLEFDRAVVLNANSLASAKEFYVAITRGRLGVTVLSKEPTIKFPIPTNCL